MARQTQLHSGRQRPRIRQWDAPFRDIAARCPAGQWMAWAEKRGVRLEYIHPGNPQQNAYIERFNRTVRGEWLGQYIFETIEEAQDQATEWLWTYNNPSRALLRNTLPGSGPTQHGHRRHHTRNETKNGRVNSTAGPH